MNIFKRMINRSGKIAISAMQAVGLTAVVGVAGIAAWQILGTPEDDATMFNPAAQYNSGSVEYVASGRSGSYGGVAGGSSLQVSADTLKRLDRQALAEQAALEMEEEASRVQTLTSMDEGPAYQMGGTEGFALGANAANEQDLKGSPLSAMQGAMSGLTDAVAKAQKQAQSDNAASQGNGTLASATPNWSAGAGSSAGGQGANSSFVVQNSGKNAKGGKSAGADAAAAQMQDALATAQAQAAGMLEGKRLRGRSSFGDASGVNKGRDASILGGRNGANASDDLDFIRKRSADAASNRYRAANEGSRAFLASTQISGGMRIEAENVTTGQGQGSKDFSNDTEVNLRGIRTWGTSQSAKSTTREEDRNTLQKWAWGAVAACLVSMLAIPILKNFPPWGTVAAAVLGLAAAGVATVAITKAAQFANKWGSEGTSTAAIVVSSILVAGVAASFIFSDAFFKAYQGIAQFMELEIKDFGSAVRGFGKDASSLFQKVINLFKGV